MKISAIAALSLSLVPAVRGWGQGRWPYTRTTSGLLQGASLDGVYSFKGVPFAQPPLGNLRFSPPEPILSTSTLNATTLAPACVQQFVYSTAPMIEAIFDVPAPAESEDCLYLNVWTPSLESTAELPVLFWVFGGSWQFGTASMPLYDGQSIAQNQHIVVVTINYRTNVFGFPTAEELFPQGVNLGFQDMALALEWVQINIAAFGGDPQKVTMMGQSAGSKAVALLLNKEYTNPPFRAAIMESGAASEISYVANYSSWDNLTVAMNCTQAPGPDRLACMKEVPALQIRNWTNSAVGLTFPIAVDNITVFQNPYTRMANKSATLVPILIGADQDDGTLFTTGANITNLTSYVIGKFGTNVTADQVRAVYPGLNDTQILPLVYRDYSYLCPAAFTTAAYVAGGVKSVYRYVYGAAFTNNQPFAGAGAWHSSEISEIWGTYNATTATAAQVQLSKTLQTVWANFIKDPYTSPAPNWAAYEPTNTTNTLAQLAYNGNYDLWNIVQPVQSTLDDASCVLWKTLLDY